MPERSKGRKPRQTRQPRKGLSRRQRKLVVGLSEGKTVRQAKLEAGYRSTSLKAIFRGNRFRTGIRALLDQHGLTDTRIANAFKDALEATDTKWLKQLVPPTNGETGEQSGKNGTALPAPLGDGYIAKVHADNQTRLRAAEDLAQMRGMMDPPIAVNAMAGITFIVNGINPAALRPAPKMPEKLVGTQKAVHSAPQARERNAD